MTEQDIQRFWSKVDKNGPVPTHRPELGQCWIWTGFAHEGYGRFWFQNRNWVSSRFAYIVHNGPFEDHFFVLHHCDNANCVRPDHLWIGTQADNIADKVKKNRQSRGDSHGTKTHPERIKRGKDSWFYNHPEIRKFGDSHWTRKTPERLKRGEQNPQTKHTKEQIIEMRSLYFSGKMNQRELGQMFCLDPVSVGRIVNGKSWGHVKEGLRSSSPPA